MVFGKEEILVVGYFSSWLRRTLIAVRGFFAWIKHSYPFVLLPSTLLLFVWLMEYGWLEKTIIFSLGMILVIAERMFVQEQF